MSHSIEAVDDMAESEDSQDPDNIGFALTGLDFGPGDRDGGEGVELLFIHPDFEGIAGVELDELGHIFWPNVYPQLKVLFMSGYMGEAVVHHGIFDSDIAFLQKPFAVPTLILKVREILDN